jgi:hypothetical protein
MYDTITVADLAKVFVLHVFSKMEYCLMSHLTMDPNLSRTFFGPLVKLSLHDTALHLGVSP